MKTIVISSFYLFYACLLWAGSFEDGLAFAKAKNWEQAEKQFTTHLKQEPIDANAYYNLGLCQTQLSKPLEALFNFEKAYKLDPSLHEAIPQIELSRKKLDETLPHWEAPYSPVASRMLSMSMGSLFWVSQILAILLAVGIFVLVISKKHRKPLVAVVIFTSFTLVWSCYFTLQKKQSLNEQTHALVIREVKKAFLAQSGNGIIDFNLKTGTRVRLLEQVNGRVFAQLDEQHKIWLDEHDLKPF